MLPGGCAHRGVPEGAARQEGQRRAPLRAHGGGRAPSPEGDAVSMATAGAPLPLRMRTPSERACALGDGARLPWQRAGPRPWLRPWEASGPLWCCLVAALMAQLGLTPPLLKCPQGVVGAQPSPLGVVHCVEPRERRGFWGSNPCSECSKYFSRSACGDL